jgi:hypothetical protein
MTSDEIIQMKFKSLHRLRALRSFALVAFGLGIGLFSARWYIPPAPYYEYDFWDSYRITKAFCPNASEDFLREEARSYVEERRWRDHDRVQGAGLLLTLLGPAAYALLTGIHLKTREPEFEVLRYAVNLLALPRGPTPDNPSGRSDWGDWPV